MRTATRILVLGSLVGLTPLVNAQQGVVYAGDLDSIDRATLEAADLTLPTMTPSTRVERPAATPAKRPITAVRPVGRSGGLPTAGVRPIGRPAAAPAAMTAPQAKDAGGFFSRLKPRWPFGGSEKPTATDPFLDAKRSSREALTRGVANAASPIPVAAAGGVQPAAYQTRTTGGRAAAAGKPSPRRGALPLRESTQPRRGLLSGLWGQGSNSKPTPQAAVASRGVPVAKPTKAKPSTVKPSARMAPQLFARQPSTARPAQPAAKPAAPRGMPRQWATATPPSSPTVARVKSRPAPSMAPTSPSPDSPSLESLDAIVVSDAPSPAMVLSQPTPRPEPVRSTETLSKRAPAPIVPGAAEPELPLIAKVTPAVVVPQEMAIAAEPTSIPSAELAGSLAEPAATPAMQPIETAPLREPTPLAVAPYVVASDSTYTAVEPGTGESGVGEPGFIATSDLDAAESGEPSERAQALLREAHELASHATTPADHTAIVQRCRYVLAIDRTAVAAAYANQLAAWSLNKRGEAMEDAGELDRAASDYQEALRCDAECWRAEHNLGMIAARRGENDEAHRRFTRTLAIQPEHAKAFANRAALELRRGRFEQALADYRSAIEIDPDMPVAHLGRGRVCHMLGYLEEGLRHLDAAAILAPSDADVAVASGDLLMDLGRYGQARDAYERAISLAPNRAAGYRNLAWLQATCPVETYRDGAAALVNADRATELLGEADDLTLDTRAAALAALGRFDEAAPVQQAAIEIAPEPDAEAYRERLAMYERGESFLTAPVEAVRTASYATEADRGVLR